MLLLLGQIVDGDRLVHHVQRMVHRLLLIRSSRSVWSRVFDWQTVRLLLVADISRLASRRLVVAIEARVAFINCSSRGIDIADRRRHFNHVAR